MAGNHAKLMQPYAVGSDSIALLRYPTMLSLTPATTSRKKFLLLFGRHREVVIGLVRGLALGCESFDI
jgi:hypothetical protein